MLLILSIFSTGRCCFYLAIRSIFEGWMLLLLSNAQFFQAVDAAYTKKNAVFLGGGYCL